ncbi:RDD family protein [Streptosporangium sp. NPDC001559]|uniref:RDD family protein n=1 Tax=Streptosporangium sp. NPDC001559 TaxID=3366187 RepID=UPI0036ECFD20
MSEHRSPRTALLTWVVAMAVAAVPTWEEWRFLLQPAEYKLQVCLGGVSWDGFPLTALRGDLDRILANVMEWAVPAALVLVGLLACLGGRDPRRVGRRTAALLVLVAVAKPLVPPYMSDDGCGLSPLFGAEWFDTVLGVLGEDQICLLGAAVLVLWASATMERPTGVGSTGVTWRRPVALLADYAIILVILTFVVGPVLSLLVPGGIGLEFGILNRASLTLDHVRLEQLVILAVVFLYFWGQHALWGRTPGKRLTGIHLVRTGTARTAPRALFFPILVFVPVYGPLVLIVDGAWTLLDPEGRTLHDRLAGTEVSLLFQQRPLLKLDG